MAAALVEARRESVETVQWLEQNLSRSSVGQYWRLLDELKATYGVDPKRVNALLRPRGHLTYGDLPLDLPDIEVRQRLYKKAMALFLERWPWIEVPGHDHRSSRIEKTERLAMGEYRHLRALLAVIEQQRARELEGAARLQLSVKQRSRKLLGTLPPKTKDWGWIGDRAAAVMSYLMTKIPAQRSRERQPPGEKGRRTTKAATVTGDLLHLCYPWVPRLTPQDVQSRFQRRNQDQEPAG